MEAFYDGLALIADQNWDFLVKLDGDVGFESDYFANCFAEFDKDEDRLTYRSTIENSGNSIIAVVIIDKTVDINNVRDIFNDLGCQSERVNDGYFSMEVLAIHNYLIIQQKLVELEKIGVISYAEPWLSNIHSDQI